MINGCNIWSHVMFYFCIDRCCCRCHVDQYQCIQSQIVQLDINVSKTQSNNFVKVSFLSKYRLMSGITSYYDVAKYLESDIVVKVGSEKKLIVMSQFLFSVSQHCFPIFFRVQKLFSKWWIMIGYLKILTLYVGIIFCHDEHVHPALYPRRRSMSICTDSKTFWHVLNVSTCI